VLENVAREYETFFKTISEFIGNLDVSCANALNAIRYKYIRPIISDSINKESFVSIKGIRHPIIERLIDIPYIVNDIDLGGSKTHCGMLLYGTNATGKSSLGKSVALAIIIAANEMTYKPYSKVFARIPTGDDLFKGHSTFVVEMLELRNILNQADETSFCISDELCNGTESISGSGIVATVIEEMCSKRCSFITASHLHEIAELPFIKSINNLRICHLEVRYDEITEKLYYNRILKDGSGSSVYGLEVCRSLGLSSAFLSRANEIRKYIMTTDGNNTNILSSKRSRYNASIYFDKCMICLAKTDEIHHIIPQCEADDKGFIGNIHKNSIANLCGLCTSCHDKVHSGNIIIEGYKTTGNGRELIYKLQDSKDESQEVNIVKTLLKEGFSQVSIFKHIQKTFPENKITMYKIKKIIKTLKV
jgi:DNA mismatch repair protein MutS